MGIPTIDNPSIPGNDQEGRTRTMIIMGVIILVILMGFVVIGFSGNGQTLQPVAAPLPAPVVAAPPGPNTAWVGKSLLTRPDAGPKGGARIGM
jgi:hypothetical protein